ncbi:heterodisulfide reductase, subunit L [Candidatus Sulfopaludibacter sp. SbA4]|nr:heterodisulfide reductase, subunit L [Candidatus Sulfopaludibacter sp. SbA4]
MNAQDQNSAVGAAMVVGGGIGGMQAALDLADAGIKVYLVETKSAIGGRMAQLDKTFPTNDCAMCTMAPRLVEIGRHRDIEILTLSDVERVEGQAGHFAITVKRRPRFVDETKCTGCGLCTTSCPVTLPSEFDFGLGQRKAVYRPYPQAVPNVFAISRRGASPCQAGCPIHQSAQGYVALVAQGRFDEALEVILRDNPIPSICGRVCTHPCGTACTRRFVDDRINMPALKRFVTDRRPDYQFPKPSVPERPEKIAIVGSGPAGLVCAYHLRQKGYQPVVFEALPVAGGMLAVGIPSFRLPRPVLHAELERLSALGIQIRVDTPVGRAIRFDELRRQYAAVFVAIGAHLERRLSVPGDDLPGVIGGLEFLRRVNLEGPQEVGRRVLVIGGGNSALDAARTALRCGAAQVTLVYRRTRAEMPANAREIEDAEHEGVKLVVLAAPSLFQAAADGRLAALQCVRMRLGAPDASGRPAPQPIPGSEFALPCDTVIVSIGQTPDVATLGERLGLDATRSGTLSADPVTLETAVPGVFVGGDCVTGPDVVVTAMLAGKKAAISIDRWLNGQDLRAGRELEGPYPTQYVVDTAGWQTQRQVAVPALDPAERAKSFDEVQTGYTEEQAVAEARRCLSCGICSDCHMCADQCQAGAIDFGMREERRQVTAGAVVLAPGFEPFNPASLPRYGYGRFPNVITALEFERILSASGPYAGHVQRPGDQREPQRIAFIQCVGSRDCERDYCSSVCCMYATKEALMAKEHVGDSVQCDIFYMDLRAFGKGFEGYYERAKARGVNYIRSRPVSIEEAPGTGNPIIHYLGEGDRKKTREYDLVVLSTGMQAPRDSKRLAEVFGIELNEFNFCRTSVFSPAQSSREGVYVGGTFTEPKDIPETVMQASAAASNVLALLKEAKGSLIAARQYPPEIDVSGQPARIGVFVCHCGTNIAGVVDVPGVVEYAKTLADVEYAEDNLYTCSNDAQERIKQQIRDHHLNRVIVASCSPRTHEPLFRNTCREGGLNFYLFEMANIRDQCSWVHMHEHEKATQKAKDLVRMAVAKARLLEPLQKRRVPVKKAALVIGGGLAGMVAATELAAQGVEVHLVEREKELGGNLRRIRYLFNGEKPQEELKNLIGKVSGDRNIRLFTNSRIMAIDGSIGNFKTTISNGHGVETVEHGVAIVATGGSEYQPKEYGCGNGNPDVITQLELESRLSDPGHEAISGTVVMIQCVGSRDKERPYCSRVCCSEAVKNALKIKQQNPSANVYVLYRDIRTYGFREGYYSKAREQGVVFLRYEEDRKPEVAGNGGRLDVTVYSPLFEREILIQADLVVLSAGIVPDAGNQEIAQLLKIPRNQDGFFLEAHMKLRPVDFATDGVFVCGLAHAAKSIDESIIQAQAAAARASAILSKDYVELEGTISSVVVENCDGCAYCVDPCPYKALTLVEYVRNGSVKKMVEVNESLCKGCGTCQATCPKNGIVVRGFKLEQLAAQVSAALEVV